VVTDYIDKACRKKKGNDGSYIGKEEKWNGQEREREKVAVCTKRSGKVDLIVEALHGG